MSWCYSQYEEGPYYGQFDNKLDCLTEGQSDCNFPFFIGESEPPIQPEELWDASDWLEHVSVQDDYSMDCADSWDCSTREQRDELNESVRKLLSEWLDRHQLRPGFFIVKNPKKVNE